MSFGGDDIQDTSSLFVWALGHTYGMYRKNGLAIVGNYIYYSYAIRKNPPKKKFVDEDNWESERDVYYICRSELTTGKRQILREIVCDYNGIEKVPKHLYLDNSNHPCMGVYDYKIYFLENGKIYRMDTDGENVEPVASWAKVKGKTCVGLYVCQSGILACYDDGSAYASHGLGLFAEKEKVSQGGNFVSFSADEIIYRDGTLISPWNPFEKKTTVAKKYPGTKGKFVAMVDSDRGIAYHVEGIGSESTYSLDWKDIFGKTIVGTDRSGNVVDEWKLPGEPELIDLVGSYNGLYFNGKKLFIKYCYVNNWERRRNHIDENAPHTERIVEYDRNGKTLFSFSGLKEPGAEDGRIRGLGYICGDNFVSLISLDNSPVSEYMLQRNQPSIMLGHFSAY